MQWSKQHLKLKIMVLSLKQMWKPCFCNHGKLNTTKYWLNLVINSSMTLQCTSKAKAMRTIYVIIPEKTILLSAIVKSQKCCIEININLCSCVNKKSINIAVAPQSAINIVLNKVFLLAIVNGRTM